MPKTVTFSFSSTQFIGTEATETFSLEELQIKEDLEATALQKRLEEVFQAWVWEKLNISYSIMVEEHNLS
ncbi:hypothetical protein [Niallia taxi]|uniref:hypothetical protein n=1 Tax=Niallia taxi TaxID=2499688 RepID=UPI0011A51DAB|nr:hypothetical protein [Niallia taxi]MCT2346444.1 hypothetical protein [Niallia taxi]MDE5053324.1 hypothetical protein [Niallia taxi]WOD61323.1 hypothetical protein NQZ71_10835 [Niallia taxi]